MQGPECVSQLWVLVQQVQAVLCSNAQQAALGARPDVVRALGFGNALGGGEAGRGSVCRAGW
jgi:hypothetical protein